MSSASAGRLGLGQDEDQLVPVVAPRIEPGLEVTTLLRLHH